MKHSTIEIDGIGTIRITKKRGMKSMRLRITPHGEVAVSAPWFVPQLAIHEFIQSREDWIRHHSGRRQLHIRDGMYFGRSLQLLIRSVPRGAQPKTRVVNGGLAVYLPEDMVLHDSKITDLIKNAMHRCLKQQAEELVLPRLLELSTRFDLPFNQAYVKRLTGRWGSCDSQQNITLSTYLVQLPKQYIDYVVTHELVHTKHMNHGKHFWDEVARHCPDYKQLRKQLKEFEPRIYDQAEFHNRLELMA